MTKTLTEQWKDGELELNSLWFVRLPCGLYDECFYTGSTIFMKSISGHDEKIWQVLAPVPSYDDYKELVRKSDEAVTNCHQLEKKLAIATNALKYCYNDMKYWAVLTHRNQRILGVIKKAIKEMEGVK